MRTLGIVFSGLIKFSAGTVAVSIPTKDHITSVVTVARITNGLASVGLSTGKFSKLKLVAPKKIIRIKGKSFNNVDIT